MPNIQSPEQELQIIGITTVDSEIPDPNYDLEAQIASAHFNQALQSLIKKTLLPKYQEILKIVIDGDLEERTQELMDEYRSSECRIRQVARSATEQIIKQGLIPLFREHFPDEMEAFVNECVARIQQI